VFPPGDTVCEPGVADNVKSAVFADCTTSVTVAVWIKLPLVPVMVSVEVANGVEAVVETIKIEDPEPPLIEAGLKLAVAPVGKPLTTRDTVPVNPLNGATLAVYVVFAPAFTVCELGVAENIKSGGVGVVKGRGLKSGGIGLTIPFARSVVVIPRSAQPYPVVWGKVLISDSEISTYCGGNGKALPVRREGLKASRRSVT